VDAAAHFDWDRFPRIETDSPTGADIDRVIVDGSKFMGDYQRYLDELKRSKERGFDLDALLENTLEAFATQARVRREILRTLGRAGLGVQVSKQVVAKDVYLSKSNPCAFMDELMAAAHAARERMDERLTPLSLVIDRYWMRIDRRPGTKEAD